jgi:hypothetical protein
VSADPTPVGITDWAPSVTGETLSDVAGGFSKYVSAPIHEFLAGSTP